MVPLPKNLCEWQVPCSAAWCSRLIPIHMLSPSVHPPSPKSDSGKSVSIVNQHSVLGGPLGTVFRSFTTGIYVSSLLIRGAGDSWRLDCAGSAHPAGL